MVFFEFIPYVNHDNIHVVGTVFVVILLSAVSLAVYKKVRHTEECVIPDKKFSLRNTFELIVETLSGMARDIIGPNGERYVPFIGSLFLFILTCNLLGLIPGFLPPTENMNTNLACALVVFCATHYYGIREHGLARYLKKFMAPVTGVFGIFLSLLFFPIEIFSNLFRPMSLSIRLFGNINGDHSVLDIFSSLVPIAVPVLFLFLGLLVSLIQAVIFSLLSMIYISLAVSHDH